VQTPLALKNAKFWCELLTFVQTPTKKKENKITAATPQLFC